MGYIENLASYGDIRLKEQYDEQSYLRLLGAKFRDCVIAFDSTRYKVLLPIEINFVRLHTIFEVFYG